MRSLQLLPVVWAAWLVLSGGRGSGNPLLCVPSDTVSHSRAYYDIDLRSPGSTPAREALSGYVKITKPSSVFPITVTTSGVEVRQLSIVLDAPAAEDGTIYVVWVAPPELRPVRRLGSLRGSGTVSASVALNKFLVFVTRERMPPQTAATWEGPILLKGKSRSGRMRSITSHPQTTGPC